MKTKLSSRSRFTTHKASLKMKSGVALLAAALLLPGGLALAQQDVDKAKNYFNTGAAAYDMGKYDLAIQAFTQAYQYDKLPAILFSIAQAERKQWTTGKDVTVLTSAVAHYHQYLAEVAEGGRRDDATSALQDLEPELARVAPAAQPVPTASGSGAPGPLPIPAPTVAPPKPQTTIAVRSDTPGAVISIDGAAGKPGMAVLDNPSPGMHKVHVTADGYFDADTQVQAIDGQLYAVPVELREKPSLLGVNADDGADIAVDGRVVAKTPLYQPVEVTPGAHYVVITKNGKKAFTEEVNVAHGQRLDLDVRFENSGQRVAAEALFIAGAAVVVAGGAFTAVSLVEQSRAQKILNEKAAGNISITDVGSYNSDVNARDTWKTASLATYAGGLALLATGAVLFFFDHPNASGGPAPAEKGPSPAQPPPPKHPDMEMGAAPFFAPGAWGIAATGRF